MKPFRPGLVFGASVLFTAVVFGSEVYHNDFSTRTSKKPVPAGRWYESAKYRDSGLLAYSYLNSEYTKDLPYKSQSNYQDSWAKQRTTASGQPPAFKIQNHGGNKYVAVDTSACANSDGAIALVLTPFYNDFTCGVVRISCDLRYTDDLTSDGCYVRVRPLYKAFLDPDPAPLQTKICPTAFGFMHDKPRDPQGGKAMRAALVKGTSKEEGVSGTIFADGPDADPNPGKWMTDGHWYRFVVDLDLDAQRANGVVYDLGTGYPEMDEAVTDDMKLGDFGSDDGTGGRFYFYMTPERGPLSGVALNVSKVKKVSYDIDKAPAFDNLTVSWKAPGSDGFVSVYENDFNVRRYRTIERPGETEADYSNLATSPLTYVCNYPFETVFTNMAAEADQLVPNASNTDPEPVGFDSWRRVMHNGILQASVVNWTKEGDSQVERGGKVLRVARKGDDQSANDYIWLLTPFGEKITTGKVRLTADFKVPKRWTNKATRNDVGIALLDDVAYDSKESLAKVYALRGGVAGINASGDNVAEFFVPYYNKADGYVQDTTVSLEGDTWYRAELTADMDNPGSGTMRLWKLGSCSFGMDDEPVGDPVFTRSNMPFRKEGGVENISSFAFYATNCGKYDSRVSTVAYDNVKVEKIGADGSKTLIYSNDFSASRQFAGSDTTTAGWIGSINNDNGVDHWIRRGSGVGNACLLNAGNPCAAMWMEGDSGSYAVQSFGRLVQKGSVQVDIRPPARWSGNASTRTAAVSIGGDTFSQGLPKEGSTSFVTAYSSLTFGFTDRTGTTDKRGYCTNVDIYVTDGSKAVVLTPADVKLNVSHWYRYRADFDVTSSTWAIAVYDMGAEQPTADAVPPGAPLAVKTDIAFRVASENGLSAICFNTQGNTHTQLSDGWGASDLALFDNVVVTKEDRGTAIILR